jgi:hypothetical protein
VLAADEIIVPISIQSPRGCADHFGVGNLIQTVGLFLVDAEEGEQLLDADIGIDASERTPVLHWDIL